MPRIEPIQLLWTTSSSANLFVVPKHAMLANEQHHTLQAYPESLLLFVYHHSLFEVPYLQNPLHQLLDLLLTPPFCLMFLPLWLTPLSFPTLSSIPNFSCHPHASST